MGRPARAQLDRGRPVSSLLLLGLGLLALAAIGWQAAVNREQRHGRLDHPED